MKCFYHSADLDGRCSGAIVKMAYPECEMIGINYGDVFPWESILIGGREQIFMVDFSLQPYTEMRKLNVYADPLVWIDHHKSAIEEHEEWLRVENRPILGIQRSGIGACALVWEYLQQALKGSLTLHTLFTLSTLPTFVKLLAEYDVWDHSDPRTLPFQYGMHQNTDTKPDNQDLWHSLFDIEFVNRITANGRIILDYQIKQNARYIKACAFETELDGLKCIAVNKMLTNSKLFDSIWDSSKWDAMLTFGWRKGSWSVSLYSDRPDIDVSQVAKDRGGGGHKGAAGFQCAKLPFALRKETDSSHG